MRPLLPALVLLNVALAGLIASISEASEPEQPTLIDTGGPVRSFEAPSVLSGVVSRPAAAETAMFGPSDATGSRLAATPAMMPSPPRADDIHLLGVLMAQQGNNQQSVVSLLRHGSPPVVSRLKLGGSLDGWKLISATRSTVTLSTADGTIRILQVGRSAQDRATQ